MKMLTGIAYVCEFVFIASVAGCSLLDSVFLGGLNDDGVRDIALDARGNVYITGRTRSPRFPVKDGYDGSWGVDTTRCTETEDYDVFVSKLSPNLKRLIASTFLGGCRADAASALAVGPDGNVFVAGRTRSDPFATGRDTPQAGYDAELADPYETGCQLCKFDAFIAKLSPDLDQLLAWSYLGGGHHDLIRDISVGFSESGEQLVFVTGATSCIDNDAHESFPIAPAGVDTTCNGDNDAFVSVLDGDLKHLLGSTYLGGSAMDFATGVAWYDTGVGHGDVFVVGHTLSGVRPPDDVWPSQKSWEAFPTTPGAYQEVSTDRGWTFDKWRDIFVSRLSGELDELIASTLIGGSYLDYSEGAIGLDSEGNVVLAGETISDDYPTTPDAHDRGFNGNHDVVVSVLDKDLENLLASTYLGGSLNDQAYGLTVPDACLASMCVLVSGATRSRDFPTSAGAYMEEPAKAWDPPGKDAFVTALDARLSRIVSTYIGGFQGDEQYARVGMDSQGMNVYVSGHTTALDYPVTRAFMKGFTGCKTERDSVGPTEVFVSRLSPRPRGRSRIKLCM